MSLDERSTSDRRLGARYRLEEPDGSWWELGWDRPLGTFYAQHYRLDPEGHEQIVTDLGNGLSEIPTADRLAPQIGRPVPNDIARELAADAAAFAFVAPPRAMAAPHMLVLTPDPDNGAISAAQLAAWEASLRRWEDNLTGWAQSLYAQQGIEPRWSLPAAPATDALRNLQAIAGDNDVATFATGLGVERRLVEDLLAGKLTELDVHQIGQVCDGLHCSPYDLWGPEQARTVLHAYGPEHWPRYIEPLDEVRTPSTAEQFVQRRLEAQAADQLRVTDPPTHPHSPQPDTQQIGESATCYRRVALLASEPNGVTRVVTDASDASPDADYHFAFRQVTEPRPLTAPEDVEPVASPPPTGWDVNPRLAAVADRFRAQPWLPVVDLVRFIGPGGTEAWLGWDPAREAWEEWDDPRRYYPGPPSDVLDPAGYTDPNPTTPQLEGVTGHDISGVLGPIEFDERSDLDYGIPDDRATVDDDPCRLCESGPDLDL
jgi:hypothetical protein